MNEEPKKGLIVFFVAIFVIVITFAGGVVYLRAQSKISEAANVAAESSTPATAAAVNIATTTHTVAASTTNAIAKTVAITPPHVTTPTSSVPKLATQAPTPTSTSTPIPAASSTAPASTAIALPYSVGIFGNTFVNGDGWTTNWWGSTSQSNGFLTVEANSSTNGGEALLPGSDDWTDYTFEAYLDWTAGETFGLMARHVDDNNYVVCEFGEQAVGSVNVYLEQYINGNRTDLAHGTLDNYESQGGTDITAAIQVDGNQGACSFDGNSISTAVAGDALQPPAAGGIGFTTWDPSKNNSRIVVKTMGVSTAGYSLGPNTIQGDSY